jgi:cyclopropane fatty-acyl-phospholipid synthase-like methyltransferase
MNIGYNLMILQYKIQDTFRKPGGKLKQFGIEPGFTAVDYGCGPGRYIEAAVSLVGKSGLVYAADISEVGIHHVKKRVASISINNVIPILLGSGKDTIPSGCADVVYALDMFHHVDDPVTFLKSIREIIKKGCLFYLEDGHQSRETTLNKVKSCDLWAVQEQKDNYVVLKAL